MERGARRGDNPGGTPMAATDYLSRDWKALLDDAQSERDVVTLTRDYLATWTPEEIAALPADCRPGLMHDAEDITYWAFEYTRRHIASEGEPAISSPLLKLRTFFGHAAARMSQVTSASSQTAPSA
jgi:hypothetical protein